MTWTDFPFKRMVFLFGLLCFFVIAACEGTDTRNKVDTTVETLSGQKQIDQMNNMTSDIDKINQIQSERLKPSE